MIFPNLKCYNFVSQNVSSLPNESLAFCTTESQFINVRKNEQSKDICVEISDLDNIELIQNRFQVPFKHVDKIIYCEGGNYLAIIGIDFNHFVKVCIFFNWWIEKKSQFTKSKSILNYWDNSIDDQLKDYNQDMPTIVSKPTLEYVKIKTDYINFINFKELETKTVNIDCCDQSGNLLIGYANRVNIFKYFRKYSLNGRILLNNFVHLLDLSINFNAEHFKLTENLLLCSSFEHCQVINLDFHAEIQINSKILLNNQEKKCQNTRLIYKQNINQFEDNKETIYYLPLFQNEEIEVINGHLDEIIGPISDKYCCNIDVEFDNCLQVNANNINILFCLNLISTKSSSMDHQFEIIEEDGYSQIYHKQKNELVCRTFLLPVYNKQLNDKQLNENNNPLAMIESQSQNLLYSTFNSKLIYFNLIVFKNDYLVFYLIDRNLKIEKFKLNQINIQNFDLKNVSIDESFIYILTKDTLYTYYFGLTNMLNNVQKLKFTPIFSRNLNEFLKIVRPILLNKHLFLGSHQLINTSIQLIVLSKDDQIFTKYCLKKPSRKKSFHDAKENLTLFKQELNRKENINIYFYLINLCKSIKLNSEMKNVYLDYCLTLFKLLIDKFPTSIEARKLIIEFIFKYTDLTLFDLIGNEEFLNKRYEENGKSILEEILEHLIYEDRSSHFILVDSLYDYEQQKQLSKKVLSKLSDSNILKLFQNLNANSDLIVYLIFRHQFNKSTLLTSLENNELFKCCIIKSKILFDCEQFDELEDLICTTDEGTIYNELINYKDHIIPSINFLSHIVKLNLAKVIRFLHKLISLNISSEFIFSIFKDNKLLFILLDNYLCTTRSEQIPEKLLTNLVVNYWKILNEELNYDALCNDLNLKYQWNVYQTPFMNLLRPCRDDEDLENDTCLDVTNNNTFNKLQFILNTYSSNNEIKSLLNHLIKNSKISWSWRFQVQISDFSDAISILYDKRPEIILFYILEQQNMDNEKWILLIDFLDKKQKIHGLNSKLNHKVLYHLANILNPLEFINLIPSEWKPIMNYYFKICLDKYQANCIKNQIMNYLDKDYELFG